MYVFLSYSTKDKLIAKEIKEILSELNLDVFLAHEDIYVSEEWRNRILNEFSKTDIFLCLLSKDYIESDWCLQESGIAMYKNDKIVPLSIDGTIPPGCINHIQSIKIDSTPINSIQIINALEKLDHNIVINYYISNFHKSSSFRNAEANMLKLVPYYQILNDDQVMKIFDGILSNAQIHHAGLCASEYIPNFLDLYGDKLNKEDLGFLIKTCNQYKEYNYKKLR